VDLVGRIFDGYSAGRVNLIAPFLDFSKSDIYRYADSIQFPIAHSYSCRRGTVPPCGECLSCIERGQLNALSN